jgi:hypothetical protein
MEGGRIPRRILEWKPIGRRIRGRPWKRWIEDEEDIQAMGVRGWRKLSKERTEWKKITEKAKTHSGFNANERRSVCFCVIGSACLNINLLQFSWD